jgi:hypothetical protein
MIQYINGTTKILIVGNSNRYNGNPFIETLVRGIISHSQLYHIDISVDNFWKDIIHYDIIHIHWPELLFNWRCPTENELTNLLTCLKKWKKTARILYTRHNESVHYSENIMNRKLYEIIVLNADMIVHLGLFSYNNLTQNKLSTKQLHYVIPHHIFDTIYTNNITQSKARKALNISQKKVVILSFGIFRHEEEQLLVRTAFENLDIANKYLLAPSWYKLIEKKEDAIKNKDQLYLGSGSVNLNMLPYCFAVADIVFIQRIKILNSGNLPMGFLFNKTIIGPNIGNIGEFLDNINNFSFNPSNQESVLNALEKSVYVSLNKSQNNEQYAKNNWNTAKICIQYEQAYNKLKEL